MAFFTRPTYCIVTGASTGLGRELAVQLSREWTRASCHGTKLVLVARNTAKLEETKLEISKMAPNYCVDVITGDLSNLDTLPDLCTRIMAGYTSDKYQQAAIFHNAGSAGDIQTPTGEQVDPVILTNYLTLNFTSMWILTGRFLTCVDTTKPHLMMNMSSLIAKYPTGRLAAYGATKAARNVYCETLTIEYPNLRILNYSPGPCDTDMYHGIKDNVTLEATKSAFESMTVLTVQDSMSKLIQLIKDDTFKNATVIDYFD